MSTRTGKCSLSSACVDMSSQQDEEAVSALPLLATEQQTSTDGFQCKDQRLLIRERKVQQQTQQKKQLPSESVIASFHREAGFVAESLSSRDRHHRQVMRPTRRLLLAKPTPSEPITDPFAFVCEVARRPKFGHQYILCPSRSRRQYGEPIGLSVGPHWAGVLYTISIIGVVTLFLVRFVLNDLALWCQSASVVCALITTAFLVATAVTDPGIVVEGAEECGEEAAYCEECSIWRPDGAEHCDECGVCIYGMDHHCPWMGKCVGRGNILWFRLFNGSWMLFLSFLLIASPYLNSHKEGRLKES